MAWGNDMGFVWPSMGFDMGFGKGQVAYLQVGWEPIKLCVLTVIIVIWVIIVMNAIVIVRQSRSPSHIE